MRQIPRRIRDAASAVELARELLLGIMETDPADDIEEAIAALPNLVSLAERRECGK